jgi:hypothetical protein
LTHVFAQFDYQARKSRYVKSCLGQNFLAMFQNLITNNGQLAIGYANWLVFQIMKLGGGGDLAYVIFGNKMGVD